MTANPPPRCGDCGVPAGIEHQDGCDVARCLATGLQRLACDGYDDDEELSLHGVPLHVAFEHDCGRDVWTGEWPGDADCRRLGLYAYFAPGVGWVPCGPDHPEATEDLNRLRPPHARWDRESKRWEAP